MLLRTCTISNFIYIFNHMMTVGNDKHTFDLNLYETIIGKMKKQLDKVKESRNLH